MDIRDVADLPRREAGDGTDLAEILRPSGAAPDLRYSLAHAVVQPGAASLPHRLASSEVYYMLAGDGVVHVGEEAGPVRAGQAVYIPPGAVQWIENSGSGDLEFLCIVDPPWREKDEELVR